MTPNPAPLLPEVGQLALSTSGLNDPGTALAVTGRGGTEINQAQHEHARMLQRLP